MSSSGPTTPRKVQQILSDLNDPLSAFAKAAADQQQKVKLAFSSAAANLSLAGSNNTHTPLFENSTASSSIKPIGTSVGYQSGDPLQIMTQEFLNKCRVIPLDANRLGNNVLSIQQCAENGAWKHVVGISSRMMSMPDQQGQFNTTNGSLTLVIKLRLEGLFRMKMFDDIILETNKIILAEEARLEPLYLSNFNQDTVLDCDLSIAMKVLLYDVTAMTGHYDEAMENLFVLKDSLLKHCKYTKPDLAKSNIVNIRNIDFWLWRVRSTIVNAATRQRQWRIAVNELLSMISDLHQLRNDYSTKNSDNIIDVISKPLVVLLCRLSRAYLQIGNIQAASDYYSKANDFLNKFQTSPPEEDPVVAQANLTKGLLLFATSQYDDAIKVFENLISLDSSSSKYQQRMQSMTASMMFDTPLSPSTMSLPLYNDQTLVVFLNSIVEVEASMMNVCVNNFAICSLYLRKINDAIIRLEELIQENPNKFMNDALVFNLCTLYDLTCSPDLGTQKKKVLNNISNMFHIGDSIINWKSFRL